MNSDCQLRCKKNYECKIDIAKTAKQSRDLILELYQITINSGIMKPLVPSIKKRLDEWDDFVLDCEIAGDTETVDLLNKIADAA